MEDWDMSILKLDNVVYEYKGRYNRVKAVNGVSYAFEQGKVYAIIGKSGCGKTTLLSLMAGLGVPAEGEVVYNGTSLKEMDRSRYRREEISVIYQAFNLFPILNSVENVMYPMELCGIKAGDARKKAEELLKAMEMEDHCYKNYPSMLSGGQQQRVAIARALACNPKVILADEPTGNLDSKNGEMVIDILLKLAHEQERCVIIVTHDLAIAKKADVSLEMKDGMLMEGVC
jgi:putative ABC transport system ATP-binding protein